MVKTRTSRAALTALLALPVLALLGCAAAVAETPAATPAATPAGAPTEAEAEAPQAEDAAPVWPEDRCQDEQLAAELTRRPDLSEAGREGFSIVLTNVSEQSCSYNGIPGVLLFGADGTHLTSGGDSPLTLDFEPGALAPGESAQLEGQLTEVSAYGCTPTTATTVRVLVTSDGTGPGIDAAADLQVCGDARSELSTGPLVPAS